MGANFSRLKVWTDNEILTDEDLNAEFNNILSNFTPAGMDDYSATVGQMQIQQDPGELGSESPATSLAGEITRIRKILAEITGNDYWYQSPRRSLSTGSYLPAFILPFDGFSATEIFGDMLNRGVFQASLGSLGLLPDHISTSEANKGGGSLDLGTYPIVYPGKYSNPARGTIVMAIKGVGTNQCIALNLAAGISVWVNSSGKIEVRFQCSTADASETAKDSVTVESDAVVVGALGFQQIAVSWEVGFASTPGSNRVAIFINDELDTYEDGLTISVSQTSTGGMWVFGNQPWDVTWTKYSSFKVLPSAEASNPWTHTTGGSGAITVSNGVLTMGGNGLANISRADYGTWSLGRAVEFKLKLDDVSFAPNANTDPAPFTLKMRDDANNLGFSINFQADRISLVKSSGVVHMSFANNCMDWHVYKISLLYTGGSLFLTFYVDGILKLNIQAPQAYFNDTTAGDLLQLGSLDANSLMTCKMEYLATIASNTAALNGQLYQGYLTDISLLSSALDDSSRDLTFVTSIYENGIRVATGVDIKNRLSINNDLYDAAPYEKTGGTANELTVGTRSTSFPINNDGDYRFWSDGKTPLRVQMHGYFDNSDTTNNTGQIALAISGTNVITTNVYNSSLERRNFYVPVAQYKTPYYGVLSRQVLLPVGVYSVASLLAGSDTTDTTILYHRDFSVSIGG